MDIMVKDRWAKVYNWSFLPWMTERLIFATFSSSYIF